MQYPQVESGLDPLPPPRFLKLFPRTSGGCMVLRWGWWSLLPFCYLPRPSGLLWDWRGEACLSLHLRCWPKVRCDREGVMRFSCSSAIFSAVHIWCSWMVILSPISLIKFMTAALRLGLRLIPSMFTRSHVRHYIRAKTIQEWSAVSLKLEWRPECNEEGNTLSPPADCRVGKGCVMVCRAEHVTTCKAAASECRWHMRVAFA